MAKRKKREGSKASKVLAYKAEHPDEKPQAISEAMRKLGVAVTPSHVSNILSQARRERGVRRGGRPRKTSTPGGNGSVTLAQVKSAAALIHDCGSADAAITAVREANDILRYISQLRG